MAGSSAARAPTTGFGSTSTNAAESAADCDGTHDYLGSSYHEASNGAWANTSNRADKLTC
jgi:hypothetical protein